MKIHRYIFRIIVGFCIFFFLSLFSTGLVNAQTQEATLSISPSSSSISSVGGTRTININIANAVKLGGFEFEVHYNPSIVKVNSVGNVTLGSFLGSTGRSATLLTPIIDNTNGMVKVGAFSFGSTDGPSGSGTLASITFTGTGNGTTSLNISNILLSSSDTTPVNQPSYASNGSITVGSGGPTNTPYPTSQASGTGDANNDGYVDGVDYMYWHNRSPNADFNGNGSVDTADYVIWLNNYNQSVPTIGQPTPTNSPNATNTPIPTNTPKPTNTPSGPTPTLPPPQPGSDIWTSAEELSSKPMSGDAWNAVKSAADSLSSNPSPDLDDQNDNTNVDVLAAAIVYARTGNNTYRSKVVNALQKVESFTPNGRTLAWARETGAYALAADLVGYHTPAFEKKMRDMAETYIGSQTNKNLLNMFKMRPNNWGSQAFGSLTAIYRYLGDSSRLNEVRSYMIQSITGPKPSQTSYGSLTWQCNESDPRWINPKGCTKNCGGIVNVDGIIPDDMRRGGSCSTSPGSTGYPWEGLQGFTMGAYILERAGLSIWGVDNNAICRAYAALEGGRFGSSWKASGDDEWQLPFADHGCGTNWSSGHGSGKWDAGKNTGWGYVLP